MQTHYIYIYINIFKSIYYNLFIFLCVVVTFLYYQENKELLSSSNICIEYTFDDRWESYPRVFKIEPESIH